MAACLRYSDDVETIDPDEQKTIGKIIEVVAAGGKITAGMASRAGRRG